MKKNKRFNKDMLATARLSRGMSQAELSERLNQHIKITQSKLSKIEGGLQLPYDYEIRAFAQALCYRENFFYQNFYRPPMPLTFHRKRQKLSKKSWDLINARADIFRFNISHLLNSVEITQTLPSVPVIDPDDFDGNIEEIALSVRQYWTMPRGPIKDLTHIIENAGVVIILFDFGNDLIDGFSHHANDDLPPLIFVNSRQSKDRLRFTLAHELGHLIMHRLPSPKIEDQANSFAASFLMPNVDIAPYLKGLSFEKLLSLKLHWKTSISAILRRAKDLDCITERTYKYYIVQMNKKGILKDEPIQLSEDMEKPETLKQLIYVHLKQLSYSLEELGRLFGMESDEVSEYYEIAYKPRLKLVV